MKLSKDALACFLCIDKKELTKDNYRAGKYTKTLYKVGEVFFVAVQDEKELPKPRKKGAEIEFNWIEVSDQYLNDKGWKIYRAIV